jgi:hypothetical protein
MLGFFSNTAGVDKDKISLFRVFGFEVVKTLQEPNDPLRVVFIHLTTIGFDIGALLLHIHRLADSQWFLCHKLSAISYQPSAIGLKLFLFSNDEFLI